MHLEEFNQLLMLSTPTGDSRQQHTGMADTRVVNLNADLALLRRLDLDLLDAQVLASLPGNGSLRLC